MLIPSIDLKGGRIVQLVQGESLALESTDVDGWIARFRGFPVVQLIDLDAAMALGNNDALVRYIAAALPCRVGGGVRSAARARELLDAGATHVIVGSSLYRGARPTDPPGRCINLEFARELAREVGAERVIGAVDSKGGHVVIHGWKTTLPITAVEAVRTLEPYCAEFLYTHVDREGLMQGTDIAGDPRSGAGHDPAGHRRRRDHHARGDRRAGQPRHPRRGRHGHLHRPAGAGRVGGYWMNATDRTARATT